MRKLANEELGRLSTDDYKKANKTPIIVVLDNVRSLNNVGSVFRTADAFRLMSIYLCGITGKPPDREIQKTALGATESVDWKYFQSTLDALEELKQNNYSIYAIEQTEGATMLNDFKIDPENNLAFVFGNEVKGVQQEVINASDGVIEIPQIGTKHSLNIAVSVGIVLWEFFRKKI